MADDSVTCVPSFQSFERIHILRCDELRHRETKKLLILNERLPEVKDPAKATLFNRQEQCNA
jgi:hypothetical protein